MRIIGLTGGIATGKSTVSVLLKSQSIRVVDCDEISHNITKKGKWGWHRIVRAFGSGVLSDNGEIDREALGQLVFSSKDARKKLNQATHLPIFVEMFRQLFLAWFTCERIVVVDMPLLFETRSHKFMQLSVCVHCDESTQVERLMARGGLSESHAKSRMDAQMSLDKKKQIADDLIDNSGTEEALEHQVSLVVRRLKKGAWKHWLISPPFIVLYAAAIAVSLVV